MVASTVIFSSLIVLSNSTLISYSVQKPSTVKWSEKNHKYPSIVKSFSKISEEM
jgi:hypothetical protein